MDSKTYIIPEGNLSDLIFALSRLQRKAEKLGTQLSWSHEHDHNVTDLEGKVTRYHKFTVSGSIPKYEGWSFVATLQFLEGNSLIRAIPGETVPEKYRTATNNCDHCQTNRNRVDTFLVRHDNGIYKQIGRQCLKDFLGHDNPHNLAAGAELLAAAGALAEGSSGDGDEKERRGKAYYSLEYLLPMVSACCRTWGWTSRTMARDSFPPKSATADDAFNQLYNATIKREDKIQTTEQDELDARSAMGWAEELSNKLGKSDYEHNISVVAVAGVYDYRTLGIAASILASWQKHVIRENERKTANSQWIGAAGEKINTEVTLMNDRTHEGPYGVQHAYTFADPNKNILIWWTKNMDLTTGTSYNLKGTIKKHDTYREIKQTILTRCKIVAKS